MLQGCVVRVRDEEDGLRKRALGVCPSLSLFLFQYWFLGGRDAKGPYLAMIALLLVGTGMISLVHTSSSLN